MKKVLLFTFISMMALSCQNGGNRFANEPNVNLDENKTAIDLIKVDNMANPDIHWEDFTADDYYLSNEGKTFFKWRNPKTKNLDMNKDPFVREVTHIRETAFQDFSTAITNINISRNVTSIGKMAFRFCENLKSVQMPNSITEIGPYSFYGCLNLKEVNIPTSLKAIEDYLFSKCEKLSEIEIPSSVSSIGEAAFSGCKSLTNINIPNSVKSIGSYAFAECTGITNIDLPNSITKISWSAFDDCTSLKSVNIPSSVTTIEDYAFSDCINLASLDIPSSVTSIGSAALYGCKSLDSIIIRANAPIEYTEDLLAGATNLKNIYVPEKLVEQYKKAEGWKDFSDKIKAII